MVIVTEDLETDTPTLKTPAPHSARSRESAGGQGQSGGRLQVGDTCDLLGLGRRHKLLGLGTAPVAMLQEEEEPPTHWFPKSQILDLRNWSMTLMQGVGVG